MISPTVKKTVDLLKTAALSNEERQLLTATLLTRLGALPIRARITIDEAGMITVDGQPIQKEKAERLRKAARSLLKNFARNFVQDTVKFLAIKEGVHQNINPEQGLFAKSALWNHQEEHLLYLALAGYGFEE